MSTIQKYCSLNIELLSEFGWSIKGQPVYGPGSVFQGFVKLNIKADIPVETIRLAFYAIECIPPFDVAPGVVHGVRNTLFSIQQTLWDSQSRNLRLDRCFDYSFPFTIQLPMITFPPSIDSTFYRCKFQLIAILDTPSLCKMPIIKTDIPVVCMPFVETSLLKQPRITVAQKGELSARIKLGAQEFVPGDLIPVTLHVEKNNISKQQLQYVTVQMKLIQTMAALTFDDISDQVKTVAEATQKLLLIKDNAYYCCDADLTLRLPADLTPSYDYGKLVQISYRLALHVEQKGPFGGIWNYSVDVDDIDITIGTLGYGIRTSNELRCYSEFDELSTGKPSGMPLPKFMKAIEYEDALPLYDPSKLPIYEPTFTPSLAMTH